jgi:hypothetical protein
MDGTKTIDKASKRGGGSQDENGAEATTGRIVEDEA